MDHPEPALLRHSDGRPRLGDRVHGGAEQRDVEPDATGQLGGDLGLARQEIRVCRYEQHVVEGEPFNQLGGHASPSRNAKGPARKCRKSPFDRAMGVLSRPDWTGQGDVARDGALACPTLGHRAAAAATPAAPPAPRTAPRGAPPEDVPRAPSPAAPPGDGPPAGVPGARGQPAAPARRPATARLSALSTAGDVYTVDLARGAATLV